MQDVRTLLSDCKLDPSYLTDYARETREAIACRDRFMFRDATCRFCLGKWDETLILTSAAIGFGGFYFGDWKGGIVAFAVSFALGQWHKAYNVE